MAYNEDKALYKEAGEVLKKPSAFNQIVAATIKQSRGDLLNLTLSMGFTMPNGSFTRMALAYRRELDLALIKTTSGVYSYQQAINEAVQNMAKSGLKTVDFTSADGNVRHYQLDTATRNAIISTSSRMSGEISNANTEEMGTEFVEVSLLLL